MRQALQIGFAVLALSAVGAVVPRPVEAAEIRMLASVALKDAFATLAPIFQAQTGHMISSQFESAAVGLKRIEAGEKFDVVVTTDTILNGLIQKGIVSPQSRVAVGMSTTMLAYRLGGMPPSIDTPEALKATLLGATSISYSDPVNGGASTVYFLGVADRLGIGDAVRKKGIPTKAGEGTKPVGDGQAALGVALSSEMASSVKVVGIPLMPADPKSTIPFGAAVSSTSTAGDAATALVRFLASKDASDILDAEGFTRH